MKTDTALIRKYNVAAPRYTSYPTVPFWDEKGISRADWQASFRRAFDESNEQEGISLYIHLPFCESLCTFCGCHKHISKRHEVEQPYIAAVLKEWALYLDLLPTRVRIKELHLGGGTPTFFSADNLRQLITGILQRADIAEDAEFSFEGHPMNTTYEQMQTLYDLGFRRCSFGVQDYAQDVQKAINRVQPFGLVKAATEAARQIGYTSVSHDLVFGLPKQNLQNVIDTIKKTGELMPDRIAFYSYAHVPWIKGVGQRGFDENDLPKDEEKRALYEAGKQLFAELGYTEIGMDHFALPTDSLHKSMTNNTLHRNFMGYTSGKTRLMLGLGMSAISDSWYGFAQNLKTVAEYQDCVNRGELPIFRGHSLTEEDLIIRQHILNIMCRFETDWAEPSTYAPIFEQLPQRLATMVADGLLTLTPTSLRLTEAGIPFVRNVCMQLDARLLRTQVREKMFSKSI
jgi:oxygen-independent coproporphyrinogen III oxidase